MTAAVRLIAPLAALAALLLAAPAALDSPVAADGTPYAPGEVVVRLRAGSPEAEVSRLAEAVGADVGRVSENGFATFSLRAGDEAVAVERLLADPAVASAELNVLRQPSRIPVDEHFPAQWNMKMIGAPEAWSTTLGAGVTIAVLDTGVAYETYDRFARSPELAQARFIHPYDAINDTAHANDEDGHGTHVAGTLAQDWDAFGVAGLVPKARIMPVRVCRSSGCPADAIAAGIYWASDHGADIINLSLGGPVSTEIERVALAYAETQGVVVVAAAGNGGGDLVGDDKLDFPARINTVISAGALDRDMERSGYSNYGPHETETGLHLMAPGGATKPAYADGIIQSTFAFNCGGEPGDVRSFSLCSYYGTSMAAAHISGIAAMLLSVEPGLKPLQVRQALRCAAIDLGKPGYDVEYGAGMSFAPAAVADWDQDGHVDCLDPRPAVTASADKVQVRPGETARAGVEINAWAPGVSTYEVSVAFDATVVTIAGCEPRDEAICVIGADTVTVSGSPSAPLSGRFRIAYLDFAAGPMKAFTSLHLSVQAISARVPDIGLQLFTKDGSVRVSDPGLTLAGDLDCDAKVKPADAVAALSTTGGTAAPLCAAQGDVNCSGGVDARDGLAIIAYIADVARPAVAGCPAVGSSLAPEPELPDPVPASPPQ